MAEQMTIELLRDHRPWHELESSNGNASSIEMAIHSLCDGNDSDREGAYWNLENGVVLQGTLYNSAYRLVCELLPRLDRMTVQALPYAYGILGQIAYGVVDGAETVHAGPLRVEIGLKDACVMAMTLHLNQFICDIALSRPNNVRLASIQLLCALTSIRGVIVPIFQITLASETDDRCREQMLEFIHVSECNLGEADKC